MPTSPHYRRHNGFLFCDFFLDGHPRRSRHNVDLRFVVTILVIAAAPVWALAQNSKPAKVSKTDAQKGPQNNQRRQDQDSNLLKNAKLGRQMEQANETGDSEKFDALLQRVYDLGKSWVPNMPCWLTAFRTSTRNRKSVRRLVRRWMRSITCVEGNARSSGATRLQFLELPRLWLFCNQR
jgi:hypothetical protein